MAVGQRLCILLISLLITICLHESMSANHHHNVCYSGPHGCHAGMRNGWLLSCKQRYFLNNKTKILLLLELT